MQRDGEGERGEILPLPSPEQKVSSEKEAPAQKSVKN